MAAGSFGPMGSAIQGRQIPKEWTPDHREVENIA